MFRVTSLFFARISPVLLLAFLTVNFGSSAAIAFEGILDVRVTANGNTNVSEFFLREAGDLRADVSVSDPITGAILRNTVLVRAQKPNGMAHILHNTRQWERHTLTASKLEKERYIVEKRGEEVLLGRKVRHILVIDSQSGDRLEMWLDATISTLDLLDRVLRKGISYAGSIKAALDEQGIVGFPLKMRYQKRSNGHTLLMEVFRVTPKKLAKNLWRIPAGYSQGVLPASPFSRGTASQKKRNPLEDASKSLRGLFSR